MFQKHLINVLVKQTQNAWTNNSAVCKRAPNIIMAVSRNLSHKELMLSGGTIQKFKDDMRVIMGIERGYSPIKKSRSHLIEFLPKTASELPARSMTDSFLVGVIPLSKDIELQEKYITFLGTVRIGRLLEDLDIFAVMVAMKHIYIPKLPEGQPSPYTIVTASVDRIDFSKYVATTDADIRIKGHVSWVGRSSLEIAVWLEQFSHGTWQPIGQALFLLAARDPTMTKSVVVNGLVPANDTERAIYAGGEIRRKGRTLRQSQSVTKVIPNEEEQKILHELFIGNFNQSELNIQKRSLPPGRVEMAATTLSNLVFSQPQDRNFHNKVFGGFLMRKAMELSWTNAYLFSKYRPQLKSISDIVFNKPIAVNSLIRMHSSIVYTELQFIQITVYAETFDAMSGKSVTANAFHFTYEVPQMVQEVVPSTYHENMMYIDGRRRFANVMDSKGGVNFEPIVNPQQDDSST